MRMIMAALLAASPALAQEAPAQLAGNARSFNGTWSTAGDVDAYTLRLEKGRDYALGCKAFDETGFGRGRVRAPGGAAVGKEFAIGDEQTLGIEWRAQAGGDYRITLTEANGLHLPVDYGCAIDPDCRPLATTTCALAPGGTKSWPLTSWNDVDWVRLANLTAGRSYQLAAKGGGLTLQVVTGDGKVQASGNPIGFKGAAGLFARVRSSVDDPGPFELSLR